MYVRINIKTKEILGETLVDKRFAKNLPEHIKKVSSIPKKIKGKANIYKNSKGVSIDDQRGNTYTLADSSTATVDVLDFTLPDGAIFEQKPGEAYKLIKGKWELDAKLQANQMTAKVDALADAKVREAKSFIAGREVSSELLAEYQLKEQAVLNNDVAFFEEEAEILGTTSQAEFDLAKAKAITWRKTYNKFRRLIAAFRRKVGQLIKNGEFAKVKTVLEIAKDFDASTTIKEIKGLFL